MAEQLDVTGLAGTGMNSDDSPESVYKQRHIIEAVNMRFTGTAGQDATDGTNIESTTLIFDDLFPGISNVIGGNKFTETGQTIGFRYNSGGHNQILLYEATTGTARAIYTDIIDSGGAILLPLNPQNIVKCVLINDIYLVWWAKDLEVGYTNLPTLSSGGYGSKVLAEDLGLLKPQCMQPITGTYGSDQGQPANYLYGLLPQFNCQYVNADFNYSTWSTWSKRIVPYQQNTPTLGSDVTKNNYIIVSVNIGSIRATTLNIACRFGTDIFSTIKSVDRAHVVALPNTSVDVPTEIYEAYDPATNLYSFAFYNNEISIPITPTETDLAYDFIWPANAGERINGNYIALADWKTLYDRPITSASITAIGYDPNIDIPAGTYPDPLRKTGQFNGESGSGAGNHKRIMEIDIGGIPHTGDQIIVILADIRDANNTQNYTYPVPSGQDGDLFAVVVSVTATLPRSNYFDNGDGTWRIKFIGDPYFGLQTYAIKLFFAGAPVANSIETILDNTTYQPALSYRDGKGRYFPLRIFDSIPTPSYAQVNGQADEITWTINDLAAPVGAVDYQWLLTKPPVDNLIDTLATPLNFKGEWNSRTNTPTLAVNVGTVGDTYQITVPTETIDVANYKNLGSGQSYLTGYYVVYNGQSWDILPKDFGDLTSTGSILAFSLNPLNLFNSQYANQGVSTVLAYDFSVGDRCTLHYYIDGGVPVFINNPCVNLSVFGYDAGNYIVKVEKPATFDTTVLNGKNVFLRLYSPAKNNPDVSAVQQATVWREIGERFTITNGNHDVLTGSITSGGAYYKTRQFSDSLQPYADPPVDVLATDLNYSDFYPSAFGSFGRPRTFYDELEKTEQKASIITSQNYIIGSRNNGLNRFYPGHIYGDGDGQVSSSQGGIQILWQRGDVLIAIQEFGIFYIPVNEAYTVLNDELTGQSISSKLLNNGRYEPKGVGIGLAKESFCFRYDKGYLIDPHKSLPYEMTLGGVNPISHKKTKYFKSTLQFAYSQGKKLLQYYNDYYEEVILCIQADSGILILFPFSETDWNIFDGYTIVPGDITATPNGSHSTSSYNSSTGILTVTPDLNYVGNDVATFTFNTGSGPVTKNICLNWTAGSPAVNPFSFADQSHLHRSTVVVSNSILVSGNTAPAPISISGGSGEYSINGGAYTSSSGTVNNGDTVTVRVTTGSGYLATVSTTLTVDTQSATFNATTFAATILNIENIEAATPYGDSNIQVKLNGVPLVTINGSGTGASPYSIDPGVTVSSEAFAELPTTGSSATLNLNVKDGVTVLFNDTEPNNPPPTVSIVYPFTSIEGHTNYITATSTATGSPGYTVINQAGSTIAYNIYDGSHVLTSSGTMLNNARLDIESLITGGANSSIEFVAFANGTYSLTDIPSGTITPVGPVTSGTVFLTEDVASIAAAVGAGNQGLRVTYVP